MTDAILRPDMSFTDYLAHPSYGSSDISAFVQGPPALVQWRRTHSTATDATRIGTAAHCQILEPALFDSLFYVKEKGEEFRTNEAKAKRDALLAAGITILTAEQADQIVGVVNAFNWKREAITSLRHSLRREASIFWTCEQSGLPCRARPDWFDGRAVYDLKVSIAADKPLDRARAHAYYTRWLHQLAHNRAGLRALGIPVSVGRLVVISPTAPHNCWLLEASENDLDVLELENENARCRMMVHHQSGEWPGTPNEWQPCPLPADHIIDIAGAEEAEEGDDV